MFYSDITDIESKVEFHCYADKVYVMFASALTHIFWGGGAMIGRHIPNLYFSQFGLKKFNTAL